MILTESKLRELPPEVRVINEAMAQRRMFSEGHKNYSVFLSHKHDEIEYLNRVRSVLESLNAYVYVDWVDPAMQHPTNRASAERIKQNICRYDKFILIASNAAINSRWCNWEVGFGDAQKYVADKTAIFPVKQDNRDWEGSEYLQLYPTIEYFDGTTFYHNTHERIERGFYVKYYYNGNVIVPLVRWLGR